MRSGREDLNIFLEEETSSNDLHSPTKYFWLSRDESIFHSNFSYAFTFRIESSQLYYQFLDWVGSYLWSRVREPQLISFSHVEKVSSQALNGIE